MALPWTTDQQQEFATVLLGSWPGQVSAWGSEALAAYVAELGARGILFDDAVPALRSHTGRFPPNAAELASLIRQDPDRPTPEEMFQQLYGPGGLFGFKRAGVTVSPWVTAFADSYGHDRLRLLEVDHVEYGELNRKDLAQAWARFLEATEGRDIAEVAQGRRGRLGRLDVAAAVGVDRRELDA